MRVHKMMKRRGVDGCGKITPENAAVVEGSIVWAHLQSMSIWGGEGERQRRQGFPLFPLPPFKLPPPLLKRNDEEGRQKM